MTAIAGFTCLDGLLICADAEEVAVTSKRAVRKLCHDILHTGNDQWETVVGGAGSAVVIDNAIARLRDKWQSLKSFHAEKVNNAIEDVLQHVHEKYIWRNQQTDHSIQLLIAIKPPVRCYLPSILVRTTDNIPSTSKQAAHIAIGIGADMVNYFADRLFSRQMSIAEATELAAFIFREVKEAVSDCGKGTDMWALPNGPNLGFPVLLTKDLENTIPESKALVAEMWKTAKKAMDANRAMKRAMTTQ